ncbi:MAG TPA: hypothetical protein VFF73_38370 [Planctomycetota bacterium]|nr:hypothetical protein [Planctomycetota bacterium]
MTKPYNKKTETSLRNIAAGISKALPPGKTMAYRQGTIDGPTLQAAVNLALKPYNDVHDDEAALHRDVATRNAGEVAAKQLVSDIEDGARVSLGETSDEFRALGFQPKKRRTDLTVEQKAAKAEKARQTRLARHTVGPKARKAIRGTTNPPSSAPSAPPTNGGTQPTK